MPFRVLVLLALCLALSVPTQARRPVLPSTTITLKFGGVLRTSEQYVPAACAGYVKCPLMLVFHAKGSTGMSIEKITGFDAVADTSGFVVEYPETIGSTWVFTGADSDPMFMAALVANLAATGLIDPLQVYAAGYSEGGGMANQTLACNPTLIKGIGIVADNLNASSFNYCGYPTVPVPILEFHGTADPISPYDGGPNGRGGGNTFSAQASAQEWATIDGLTAPPVVDGSVQTWGTAPLTVTLYTVPGGGHTWPGGNQQADGPLGPTEPTPDASAVIAQTLIGR